jgi:hypothetical protein
MANIKLTTPILGHYLGRKRDHFDLRDYIWKAGTHLTLGGPAPTQVELFNRLAAPMPQKYDQQAEGSCTANAGIRWLRWLCLATPVLANSDKFSPPDKDLSRQAQYAWERISEGDLAEDAGAQSRTIFAVLKTIGACPESDDPYGPATLYSDPGPQAVTDAAPYQIGAYHRLTTVGDLKACLISGYAFTMGFTVYDSFESIGADGVWKPDVTSENVIGGHEVFAHGFDDSVNGGSFLIDNSWGTSWGMEGSFWMPYSFLENYGASQFDAWCGHFGRPWVPGK